MDSKGNFGKAYSRDMAYAASALHRGQAGRRSAAELFSDIDQDTVDFVDNYDSTIKEPTLLPVTLPDHPGQLQHRASRWAWPARSARSTCAEVCETTIALMKNPEHDIIDDPERRPTSPAAAIIVYDQEEHAKNL